MKEHPYLDSSAKTGKLGTILAVLSALAAGIACIIYISSGLTTLNTVLFFIAVVLEIVLAVFIMHFMRHNAVDNRYKRATKAFHGLVLHSILFVTMLIAVSSGAFAYRFYHAFLDGALAFTVWCFAAICTKQKDSILQKLWLAIVVGVVVGIASWINTTVAGVLLILLGVVLICCIFTGRNLYGFGTPSVILAVIVIVLPAFAMLHLLSFEKAAIILHALILILSVYAIFAARHLVPEAPRAKETDSKTKAPASAADNTKDATADAAVAGTAAAATAAAVATTENATENTAKNKNNKKNKAKPQNTSASKTKPSSPKKDTSAAAVAAGAAAAGAAAAAKTKSDNDASAIINLRAAVTPEWKNADLKDLLKAPLTALDGITEKQARALKESFGISTIESLGSNRFIRWAQAISTTAEREE